MELFDISANSIAGIVVVEIQFRGLISVGIDVALDRLVGGRRREIERKGRCSAVRPQGIDFVNERGDEMGIELRKCVGITGAGPENGHPLSIVNDGSLWYSIERIHGRRLLEGIEHSGPFRLEGLGADAESRLTRRPASPADV